MTIDQSQFDDLAADTKATITGTSFMTERDDLVLGDQVKLVITGHVVMTGREELEAESERGILKIHADIIELG